MESAEYFAVRHLKIQIRDNVFSLYSILKYFQKVARNCSVHIYKEDQNYDMVLRIEKNNIVYGIYVEHSPLNATDNYIIDIRLFLDKYFRRLDAIAPDFDKILIYTTYVLDANDWITYRDLRKDEIYIHMEGNRACQVLNETIIQKLLMLCNNVAKQRRYEAFLNGVKFVLYEINNYTEEASLFLAPKIYRPLLNPNRLKIKVLKQMVENVNRCPAPELFHMSETFKLYQTITGLSQFNVDFINQLYVKFGINSDRIWGPVFNDIYKIVFVDTTATLLSTKKVIDYVSNKGLKFMLLSAQQLRQNYVLSNTYRLFSAGNIDVLIIECDEETKQSDNPIPVGIKFHEESKIIQISNNNLKNLAQSQQKYNCTVHIKHIFDDITLKDFDKPSLLSILSARILFQGHDMDLEKIANTITIEKCIKIKDLEDLIVGWDFQVGKNIYFDFNGPVYLQRTIRRKIIPDDVVKINLANCSLVIIFGENLEELDIDQQQDLHLKRGILLVSDEVRAQRNFHKYCKQIDISNVYLLEFKNGFFFLEDLKAVDSTIIKFLEDIPHAEQMTTDHILSRNKTNLIVGNSGMGKSVFLNHLQIQIKNNNPGSWVAYVNLGNNSIYLNNIFSTMEKFNFDSDIQKSAIELLIPIIVGDNPNLKGCQFAISLFKMGFKFCSDKCKYPNYIFLFDAFDELIENHQKKAINLFRFLMSKNITLWIASRPHQKRRLEYDLQTVALSINPLTKSQVNEYVSIYHKKKDIKMPYQNFYFQIESHLLSLDNSSAVFADYPLHLEFLTKYDLSKYGLYHLLHGFIYYKFNLFYQQKLPLKGFKVTKQIKTMWTFHKDVALSLYGLANSEKTKPRIKQDELLRVGLVSLEDDELTFIHPCIKSCFLAYSIVRHYLSLSSVVKILKDENHQDVRSILNSMDNKNLQKIKCEYLTVANVTTLIKNLTCEGNKKLAKLIVEKFLKYQERS
ncbi:hypothetical protein GWI33_001086 [Rhynchophorus ferrugineus]|uniref:NACHT domain-containing protein n=1 Tax=Rhynchophorus ferrugineus TaxID=354439 RepID=A0A834MK82_RHYFE|nr:hypothetical protein GWI33_001086 [Rhynchophorus ferrugineus]